MKIKVCARASPLSRAQVEEVKAFFPELEFEMLWMQTRGDLDRTSSLRSLEKSDFFTREIDEALLCRKARIAIHSAKDLPEPLPEGLEVIAFTKGVDPRDALVLKNGVDFLPEGAVVATSSARREEAVRLIRDDVRFVDLRGTIGERLSLLDKGFVDAVVVAEAALIRLKLTDLNRIFLPGETAPMQGRLAVVALAGDVQMKELFAKIDESSLSRA